MVFSKTSNSPGSWLCFCRNYAWSDRISGWGIAAFLLVGFGTGFVFYYFNGNLSAAIAGGIVLGAIASATDPASTIDVLWEFRAKGIVTSAVIAIIALDDALAMTLYSIGKSISSVIAGQGSGLTKELLEAGRELGGSLLLGGIATYILYRILLKTPEKEKSLAISISTLFLVIGVSVTNHFDVILSSMTLGFGISNLLPRRSEEMFHTIRSMSIPIYVLFFVLVGARFDFFKIPPMIWGIAGVYILGRSLGKFFGTRAGAKWSKADQNVENYAGYALFAQGGVAIGLAIVAGQNLQGIKLTADFSLGECIIAVVTSTTIAVQLIGPLMTKLAIKLAGEMGKNVTDEDILQSMTMADVLKIEEKPLLEEDTVENIVQRFSLDQSSVKMVRDREGNFKGVVSFDSLRDILSQKDMWQWLIAEDIMDLTYSRISEKMSVIDAVNFMKATNQEVILIEKDPETGSISGILELRVVKNLIHKKLLDLAV